MRKRTVAVGVVGCALIASGLAAAADRCHQDLPGTRSVTLWANVTGYRFAGDRVVIDWARSPGCAGTTVWAYRSKTRTTTSVSCQRPATRFAMTAQAKLSASDAAHSVRVIRAPVSADIPDRLAVVDRTNGRRVASWPLFERPARVVLNGDIAILSGAERHGIYALRISDGRIALLGVHRPGDQPLIGPAGVLYQDDLERAKHRVAPNERRLMLVSLEAVRRELVRPYSTVRLYMSYSHTAKSPAGLVWGAKVTGRSPANRAMAAGRIGASPPKPLNVGEIRAISMDGPRVAIAERDPLGQCDRVFIWNVTWHYLVRLSSAFSLTCVPQHGAGGITGVVMAGGRAAWTTTYGRETRVISASTTACREWVVARSTSGSGGAVLAADGSILAYGLRSPPTVDARRSASVGIVPKLWRGTEIGMSAAPVRAISVDGARVAVLRDNGLVTFRTRGGRYAGAIRVGAARATALRPGRLAVLTSHGTLDVYLTALGTRVHSWRVPANATSLDLHYRTALLTAGRDVFAVSIKTGRVVRLMHAPARVSAQLEGPGAVIAFSTQGHGHLRFLPTSWIEARVR